MFYLTTAIDYTNGTPHIGHAYEKVLADVISRYQKLKGESVFFLTGVDQHGQKVQQSAEKAGLSPQAFVDDLTQHFIALWKTLQVDYDGWAATTAPAHQQCVQNILQDLYNSGQIYKKAYSGFYSVRQEQFLTDRERNEQGEFGPEWGEVVELEEENYYFRLSDHLEWLKNFVAIHENFILPHFRRNELVQALERSEAQDLCISRPKSRLHWGIEFPFDSNFVTYVWFDALINYISFAGYQADSNATLPNFKQLWPAAVHVIGKDILVPAHAIYWPTMLHAMGFADADIPSLLVHGWWNLKNKEGHTEKMSKSLGNVVDPAQLAESFGVDAVRYYLMRDIHTGKDSDFDVERLVMLFNTELANNLGNLCNRALNMSVRYFDGQIQASAYDDESSAALRESLATCLNDYSQAMEAFRISDALQAVIQFITGANVYAEQQKPWELAKDPANQERLATVLHHLTEVTAAAAILLLPVIPQAAQRLADQLSLPQLTQVQLSQLQWGLIPSGHLVAKPSPVFPRIQLESDEKPV